MLFHSQIFVLCFLPLTIVLYYGLARHKQARGWLLIAASLMFYGWWDVRFLPLLIGQTLISWWLSEWFFKTGQRFIPKLAIVANLAVLGLFKYIDFGAASLEAITGIDLPRANLILPIGISFYTFQLVSYLADTLRGEAPRYGIRDFSQFVVLFPQLVAGPIVRHNEIISQFSLDPWREGVAERISRGLALFTLGIAAKVFLADRLAGIADGIFTQMQGTVLPVTQTGAGLLAFALQIFFDFAAYSEMAIGIALMMGFTLPMNFNQPYRATNLRDFWRRWHMTLSRFLRDYLYIPLGGSRSGWPRYVFATLVTMSLCGLWHGAGWTFVIWGALHGIGLIVCRAWQTLARPLPNYIGWVLTFGFAVFLFGIFRAPDLASVINISAGLTGAAGLGAPLPGKTVALLLASLAIALVPHPGSVLVWDWLPPRRAIAGLLAVIAVYTVLEVGKGQPQNFIYFQF